MKIGIKGKKSFFVTGDKTAKVVGSGTLEVLATPMMVAWMENTAASSVTDSLEYGYTPVGTHITAEHISPTPIGVEVTCESELIEVNDRELVFKIEAYDEIKKVGEATHKRMIVNKDRFQKKAETKYQ